MLSHAFVLFLGRGLAGVSTVLGCAWLWGGAGASVAGWPREVVAFPLLLRAMWLELWVVVMRSAALAFYAGRACAPCIVCVCIVCGGVLCVRGFHPFIPALRVCMWGQGWFVHAREVGVVGRALYPCVWPPHHATIRHRPHLHCPMLPPSSLPCTLPPYHVLCTCFRNSFHKSPMHARLHRVQCTHAKQFFRPYKLLVERSPPPHPPTPRMWNALTHVHHNSCMHL
jgi:hypothetical protein